MLTGLSIIVKLLKINKKKGKSKLLDIPDSQQKNCRGPTWAKL